ncbi:MAG: PIN domain-containing protein [Microscillaceae bacterium]|nr:PIN domain-containing protein [Microscillaceae bacterium]
MIYIRNNEIAQKVENQLNLFSGEHNLVISVVSIGELKSIAKQNRWGEIKWQKMLTIINDFLIADINTEEIIDKYADIDAFSQGKSPKNLLGDSARNMGKNDLWIAATASALNLELITTDNDFEHLSRDFIQLRKIDLSNI